MGQSVSLQINRSLSIAPALQRSLQLLQLNALEFEQEINQTLASNPLLEADESADAVDERSLDQQSLDERAGDGVDAEHAGSAADDNAGVADAASVDAIGEDGDLRAELLAGNEDALADSAFDDGFAEDAYRDEGVSGAEDGVTEPMQIDAAGDEFSDPLADWSGPSKAGQGDGLTALDLAPAQGSLRDHLLQQLGSQHINPLDHDLCVLVIDSLDPAGYLRETDDELVDLARDACAAKHGDVAIDEDVMRIAVKRVQSFDPPGIAARSIDECLLLQLREVAPDAPGHATARAIIQSHLELLARNDFREITAQTGSSEAELSAATRLIRSFDPKPGLAFGRDRVVFAVPEVIVRKVRGVWTAGLHPAATPKIRINTQYAEIVGRNEGGQCNGLSAQLQEAKWLLRSIEQRANTIEKTAEAIVARQQAFFEHGDIGLQPLKLADIAADVGIHESTVSRVVNSKYLQCPAGLIPLRKFFTSHVETAAGSACSATAVKAMIRQLVDAEQAGEPLSDHRLTKLLTQRGIRIARRTVTKYRDAMGIEAADLRRHLSPADQKQPRTKTAARVIRAPGSTPLTRSGRSTSTAEQAARV